MSKKKRVVRDSDDAGDILGEVYRGFTVGDIRKMHEAVIVDMLQTLGVQPLIDNLVMTPDGLAVRDITKDRKA